MSDEYKTPFWSERYETLFWDIDDYKDHCECNDDEPEEYLFEMEPVYPQIDIVDLIERMSDDGGEDGYDYLESTMDSLGVTDMLKDINNKLKTQPSWYESTRKRVFINDKFEIIPNPKESQDVR